MVTWAPHYRLMARKFTTTLVNHHGENVLQSTLFSRLAELAWPPQSWRHLGLLQFSLVNTSFSLLRWWENILDQASRLYWIKTGEMDLLALWKLVCKQLNRGCYHFVVPLLGGSKVSKMSNHSRTWALPFPKERCHGMIVHFKYFQIQWASTFYPYL